MKDPTLKRLIENFSALAILQGVNYILPLLTLPYLVKVLGSASYGRLAIIQTIILYLVLLINYGFNFSAVKKVSRARNDKNELIALVQNVTATKVSIVITLIPIYLVILKLFGLFNEDFSVAIFGIIILFGTALSFEWFFQGIEKMKFITVISAVTKSILHLPVFFIVNSPSDYRLVVVLQAVGVLTSGLLGVILLNQRFGIVLHNPALFTKEVFNEIKDGAPFFGTTAASSLYRNANILILGIFSNNSIVGYYAAAERIVKAIQALTEPVSRTLYPFFSLKAKDNSLINLLSKYGKYIIAICSFTFIVCLLFIFNADIVSRVLYGEIFEDFLIIFKVMLPIIFFGCITQIYGIVILGNIGCQKWIFKLVLFAGIFNIVAAYVLSKLFGGVGCALSFTLAEGILATAVVVKVKNIMRLERVCIISKI